MVVRVVSDKMADGAPIHENSGAVFIVYVPADCKQKGARPPQVRQESRFGFGPTILRDALPENIVHRDSDLWPGSGK